jgi:Na+/H+-dicarboxylate symporter
LSGGREVILQRPVGAPELQPLAMISLPMWISNDKALLAGFVLGVLASMKRSVQIMAVSRWLKKVAYFILNQGFIRLIPLFVLGFVLKLQHEQILKTIVLEYSVVFVYLLCVQSAYLLFLYGVSARFRLDQCMSYLKEIAPSMLSGFSTMSSMVSLPLTLKAAEKNTQNPSLARLLVPMTVNNHLLGDSIFIPFVGLLLLSSSHQIVPDYLHYLPFALYFILAKFAVAAVPGGGIIVMIPILDKYLGLSGEMLSLITAIYILFDPVITAFNVAGNGAFAILFAKLSKRLSLNHSENDSEREKIVR